jgi:hypothetical protein
MVKSVYTVTLATGEKFPRKKCHFNDHITYGLEESLTFKTAVPNYIYKDMSCGCSVHYGK